MKIPFTDSPQRTLSNHSHLIFLISLPRSGSTLLQRVLGGSRDIHTTAEPWLMLHPLHAFKTENIQTTYDQNLAAIAARDFLSQVPEEDSLYYQAVRAYGLTLYNRTLEISGKRMFLDKTPRYYTIIPELVRTFPDARFIIMLRNPMAVLSSVLHTWCRNDPSILASTSNYRDLIDGPQALIDGIEILKKKAAVVHYEHLVSNPSACLEGLCRYLDIPFDDGMLDYGSRKAPVGKFGDSVGIHQHERPVSLKMNKWLANFIDETRRKYAADYLSKLGSEVFVKLGYDFAGIESAFNSFPSNEGSALSGSSEPLQMTFLLSERKALLKKYNELIASQDASNHKEASGQIRKFVNNHPAFPEGHNDLGVLCTALNQHDEALVHFRKAVVLDSGNVTYQKNLADFLFVVQKDIQGALEIYSKLLTRHPKDIEVLYAIGQISLYLGKNDDANVFFERVIEISPHHTEAINALRSNGKSANSSCMRDDDSNRTIVTTSNQGLHDLSHPDADNCLKEPLPGHKDAQGKILVATSLAPHAIDIQKSAIASWMRLGFEVVSLNSRKEIALLKDHFPDVCFHAVERNSQELFGKPYIYFDDFLVYFKSVNRDFYGIINSDIIIKANLEIASFMRTQAAGALIYGSRLDVPSLENSQGDFYRNGFDFFFFDNAISDVYPQSIVSIGVTWWDYWAALIPALNGIPVKKLVSPFAYHVLHRNRWDSAQWDTVGRHVSEYLATVDSTFDRNDPPGSAWAVFREILENAVAVQCLDRKLGAVEQRRLAYDDIATLNICILDFLDRTSEKLSLPWDSGFDRFVHRIKGENFYPEVFHDHKEKSRKTVSPQLAQKCARACRRALIHFSKGRLDRTDAILLSVDALSKGYPPANNLLGKLAWEKGETENAIRFFNNALRNDPYDRPTIINSARAMIHLNRFDEARQIISAYLRYNPGDLETGLWYRRLATNGTHNLPLDFVHHEEKELQDLPVLVYQMGKVGSTSIVNSLAPFGIPVKHVHTLSWPGIDHAEKVFRPTSGDALPSWVRQYRGLRAQIDRFGENGYWKIITLVRDPFQRYLSDLFQNLDRYFPQTTHLEDNGLSLIMDYVLSYLKRFDENQDNACTWFDRELKAVFDFDIFSVPFDFAKGYQRYQTGRADILVVRLENLSSCAAEALEPFLDIEGFTLVDANISQSKPYASLYNRMLSELRIERPLLDVFYNTRLAKHFYSDAEIKSFKERWSAPEPSTNAKTFRVSAVVSTYASERFIEGRLQNLVDQTLYQKGELEIIVVDSNSPENERGIVETFAARYPHIVYERTPERETVYRAWNRGIAIARGTYFVNANTDDRFTPDALEAMADALDLEPEYSAAYGNWVVTRKPNDTFDSNTPKRFFRYPEFHPALFFYLQITSHANFVRRSVLKQIGDFDGGYTVFGDREFMLRFSAAGHEALKLDRTIGLYLENPTSVERANRELGVKECGSLYNYFLNPRRFAALARRENDTTSRSLVTAYIEAGCFGMGLYRIDDRPAHALGSPARLFAKAIELDPENVVALNNMGVIAQHRGVFEEASRFFEHASVHATPSETRVIDHNTKLLHQGVSNPHRLRFLYPEHYKAIHVTDTCYRYTADRTFNKHVQGHKKNRNRTSDADAPLYGSDNNNTRSLTSGGTIHFQELKATSSDSKTFDIALTSYLREDYPSAFSALQRMIADRPDHWEAYALLVDVMLQSGQEAGIPEQLHRLESHPDLPAWMWALIGSGYEAAGDLSKAAGFADQALDMDNTCTRAWNLKGVIAFRNGDAVSAAGHFRDAVDADDAWGDPWTNLGTVYWEQGRHDEALECFEKGFRLSPTAPNVAAAYHIAISETGQYERARGHFTAALERHPEFRRARFLLIDILIHLEAYTEALAHIEDLLVRFGVENQLLEAARSIRGKVGPMMIEKGKHPSLSLCMIVKNEEKYLARCLASLKPMVDEMVVVDTGSGDATRTIAEVFGARVFDYEWQNDFAAARNYSLKQASGDWILIMDADEVIAEKDHFKIRKLIDRKPSKRRAFMVVTRNYTSEYNLIGWEANSGLYPDEEVGSGWIPSEKVRLFPNRKSIYFEYPVHEVVGPSLSRQGIPIVMCPHPVHHFGKLDQIRNQVKNEQYFRIGMAKLSDSGNDPVAIREMAIQAAKIGRTVDAIKLWKQLVNLEPRDARAYINLASAYGKQGQYFDAEKAAKKAIKLAPKMKEAHLNLGLSELHLGNVAEAKGIFQKLAKHHPNYTSAVFLNGAAQLCQGKLEAGVKALRPLEGTHVWENLSYSIQEIVASLMSAGCSKQAYHLIEGAERLGCCNESLKNQKRKIEMKAA